MDVSRKPKEFDCSKCPHHYCDEAGEIEGSQGPAPFPKWEFNGEELKTCLLPMITPMSRELLKLHMHYRAGYLPLSGGILDQPAGFLRAMEIIESVPIEKK